MKRRVAAAALIIILAAAHTPTVAAELASTSVSTGQSYGTAEEAATALVDAVRSNKPDAIALVLGPGSEKLVNSGDSVVDATARQKFAAAYDEKHQLTSSGPDRMTLVVGKDDWPLNPSRQERRALAFRLGRRRPRTH
jgi:Protein of unknown function (DUF2950)